jgi:hypothetical protein
MGEIGKNLYLYEYQDTIILVDCGLAFPDETTLGVDIIIPDISYLRARRSAVKAVLIHEDCDAVEPAHEALARQIERELAVAEEFLREIRDGDDGPRCLSDPIRTAYTREEIIREAKAWLVEQYGPFRAAGDEDALHTRLGMLVSEKQRGFFRKVPRE